MWRDALEMRAGGDDPDEESELNAAFIFLQPFLFRFSDWHLDRQQSRHSSYERCSSLLSLSPHNQNRCFRIGISFPLVDVVDRKLEVRLLQARLAPSISRS